MDDPEINALRSSLDALVGLNPSGRRRVLAAAAALFGHNQLAIEILQGSP